MWQNDNDEEFLHNNIYNFCWGFSVTKNYFKKTVLYYKREKRDNFYETYWRLI